MPTMVKGEDGRELAENLGEQDALELAQRVHNNTGETVTLVPYVLTENGWVLEEKDAHVWPREQEEAEAAPAPDDLSELTVKELKALADERGIEVPKKAKKADLLAVLEEA